MSLEVKAGWEKHGLAVGKRGFREPEKVPEKEYSPMNALMLFPLYLLAVLYSLFLATLQTLEKNFWAKPVSLKGKVCLVTGSGRGLGRQICLQLAELGAKIACADINEETNQETVKMLSELGATVKAYKLNVANREEVFAISSKVEEDLGPVFLVVNNAAIVLPSPERTEEFTRATFNVNTLGPIWITDAFLPKFIDRNLGHIVNICSITSYFPLPVGVIYCASKAALKSYTESINIELKAKRSNVKVSSICPSIMNSCADYTEMLFRSKSKPVSVKMVADAVIDAVSYGIENITVPPIAKFAAVSFNIMLMDAVVFFYRTAGIDVILPSKEEHAMLPSGDLVRVGIETGNKKGN